jgi:hypothetical protein
MRISAETVLLFAVGVVLGGFAPAALAGEPQATSNCCIERGTPGCDDLGCEGVVCAADSFCCDVEWDKFCVDKAIDLCGGLCAIGTGPFPSGPDWFPDPADPGLGPFPNVKTRPLTSSETIVVPWALQVEEDAANVAGIIFRVHYDSNELDLLHTNGGPVFLSNTTPFGGPTPLAVFPNLVVPPPVPLSLSVSPLSVSAPGSSSAFRTHVGWLSASGAMGSGRNLFAATPWTFATFRIHARHTSLANSDADFSVPSIWLIRHATQVQTATSPIFSVWRSSTPTFGSAGFVLTDILSPSDLYLPVSFSLFPEPGRAAHLGLEHLPEPAVPLSLGPGLVLLGWLDRRRRRRAGGRRAL